MTGKSARETLEGALDFVRAESHIGGTSFIVQFLLSALATEGLAIVPVEPTEAMGIAGTTDLYTNVAGSWRVERDDVKRIYRAMVGAAGQ
jgi:hypothetical protein